MMKVLIRKSDNTVIPGWEDAPVDRPGAFAAAYSRTHGGNPSDYVEYCVPDKEKKFFKEAKELKWDKHKERVKAIPFSGQEKKEHRRKEERLLLEHEMVRAQLELNAAKVLGLDTNEKEKEIAKMKLKHNELKNG